MKYLFRTTSLLLFAALLLVSACSDDNSTSSIPEPEPEPEPVLVDIPDARLLAQIREALEVDDSTPITEQLMLELVILDINGSNDFEGTITEISDLTGLEYAENLEYLRLSYTSITDLSPISGLENIEYLRFNNTPITDISPLANITSLTYFNANTVTGLTDISPLAGNTGLKEAIFREVPFGNEGLETIKNFSEIYRINMRSTGVTDLTIVGEMMAAGALLDSTPGADENGGATLDLRGLSIEDWSPIEPYIDQISNLDGYPGN